MTFNMDGDGGQDNKPSQGSGFSPEQRAQLEEMMSGQLPGNGAQKRLSRRAARQRIIDSVKETVETTAPPDSVAGFDRGTFRGRAMAWFSRNAMTRAVLGIAAIAVGVVWCVVVLGGIR